jgi:histidinol-phosphatase (PHP family)
VLREVFHRGMALELNTRRLGNRKAAENIEKIYKRFHELGGRYITIGSDSHSTNAIGSNFKIAEEIADRCRLRIVYFKERKPKYIK